MLPTCAQAANMLDEHKGAIVAMYRQNRQERF
jgi:hypothetical protein